MEADAQFFVCDRICDHTTVVCFGTGSGCGGNTYDRKRLIRRQLSSAGAFLAIIPNVSRIGRRQSDKFSRVHRGAASETDNKVAGRVLRGFSCVHDAVSSRIRGNAVKNFILFAGKGELIFQLREISAVPNGFTVSYHNESFLSRQIVFMKFFKTTGAEDKLGRDAE